MKLTLNETYNITLKANNSLTQLYKNCKYVGETNKDIGIRVYNPNLEVIINNLKVIDNIDTISDTFLFLK
jgi:hypothetical protein